MNPRRIFFLGGGVGLSTKNVFEVFVIVYSVVSLLRWLVIGLLLRPRLRHTLARSGLPFFT